MDFGNNHKITRVLNWLKLNVPASPAQDGDGEVNPLESGGDAKLLQLPAELLTEVCSYLGLRDVFNVRLVCKLFSEVSTPYSHRNIYFWLHEDDLEFLENIANHPLISSKVRSVTAKALYIPPGGMFNLIQTRIAALRLQGYVPDEDEDEDTKTYATLYEQQWDSMRQGHLAESLARILPRLKALKSVILQGAERYPKRIQKRPFKHYPHFPVYSRHVGSETLQAVLESLASTPIKLQSFDTQPFDWRFFIGQPSGGPDRLLFHLHQLRHVRMQIAFRSAHGNRHSRQDVGVELAQCRSTLSTGVLRNALASMRQLRTLDIRFFVYCLSSTSGMLAAAATEDVLAPGVAWPYLRKLSLQCVDDAEGVLLGFLLAHKHSLRELALRDIALGTGSWSAFLLAVHTDLVLLSEEMDGDLIQLGDADSGYSGRWIIWDCNRHFRKCVRYCWPPSEGRDRFVACCPLHDPQSRLAENSIIQRYQWYC